MRAPLLIRIAITIALVAAPSAAVAGSLEGAAERIRARAFGQAADTLRRFLALDPSNRAAKEMLAFSLESMGDLRGELRVRSALAAEFPDDAGIQADYGRVLERWGDEAGARRAYLRARELGIARPWLDAAIERTRARSALEVGAPLSLVAEPDATAYRAQAGAAIPLGAGRHWTLLGTRYAAESRTGPAAASAGALALSFVQRRRAGGYWMAGPSLHVVAPSGGARKDVRVGGAIAARAPLGSRFEADVRAEAGTPWDEAAISTLRGGRTTAAVGRLYAHAFARRLLLQAGARRRRLTIRDADPGSTRRPEASQSLLFAGADLVLWANPRAAVRGEMLDETLTAPTSLSSAVTLAYRHYDVSTRTTPDFAALIGLVPRASVDEASMASTLASPRGNFAVQLRGGLANDAARDARLWRAGGTLIWAPHRTTRFALGYENAIEVASGLVGTRRAGWFSFHVDL